MPEQPNLSAPNTSGHGTNLVTEALIEAVTQQLHQWEGEELADFVRRTPESRETYLSGSGLPLKRVYTPADLPRDWEEIGLPGQFPFTRGPYPTMYRGRTWTMRQIAGFGQAEETNKRFQYLIAQGQTGLSVDFDMPTLMGLDSDDRDEPRRGGTRRCRDRRTVRHGGPVRGNQPRGHQRLDDDQSLGVDSAGDVHRGGRGPRLRPEQALGHDPERHPQGVRRPEGVGLPRPAEYAHRPRHRRLLRRAHGALQPRQHQRLPHQRGRSQRLAGDRVHDGDHPCLCRRRGGCRRGRRRLRFAPLLLLRLPGRPLRGGCEVPGRAPLLRQDDARRVRRQEARLRCGCASTPRRLRPR